MVVNYSGNPVNNRTMDMLREAEAISGVHIRIIQGKNPGGVSASAGTHDGWGVIDIRTHDYDLSTCAHLELALRIVGFAAWLRTVAQGFSGQHIHAVAIGDNGVSPSAAAQIVAYKNGHNGLKGNGPDDGPRTQIQTWEQYIASVGGLTMTAADDIKVAIQALNTKLDAIIVNMGQIGQDLAIDKQHKEQDDGRYNRNEEWMKQLDAKLTTIVTNTTKA